MAKQGGARTGAGRKPGPQGPRKATIEKAKIAARILEEQQGRPGKKLGREVIQDFMELFQSIAAAAQPTSEEAATPSTLLTWLKSDRGQVFERFSKLSVDAAKEVAEYQSPKFGRVQAAAPPPPPQQYRKKFTISIFDNQGRPAPRQIDVKRAKPAAVARH
jgi:hypothetical protein